MLYNVIVKVANFTLLCFLFSILDETDFALDQIIHKEVSLLLVGIYNNYISTYGSSEVNKYDTHKKEELKTVYNSIVKKAKTSPLYKVDLNESVQKYVVDLKESARLLKNTAEEFSADHGDLRGFSKKVAYSGDESKVEAHLIDADKIGDDLNEITLDVKNLAGPQVNLGNFLGERSSNLNPGTYSFDLSIDGFDYEFKFNIDEGDTAVDSQKRIVRLINKADIGLEATLAVNDQDRSAVKIQSLATGETDDGLIFKISESNPEEPSGVVSFFGLNKVYSAASDAHFTINGEENSSTSNNFTVNNAYDITLKDTTEENMPVTIGLKNDADAIMDNVQLLLNKFNAMVQLTKADDDVVSSGRKLEHDISLLADKNRSALESNGLMIGEDNVVTLDKALFTQAINEGRLSEALNSLNNFNRDLSKKATQISLDPMEYVKKTLVTYPNPNNTINQNPYMTSIYSGMMYNNYI